MHILDPESITRVVFIRIANNTILYKTSITPSCDSILHCHANSKPTLVVHWWCCQAGSNQTLSQTSYFFSRLSSPSALMMWLVSLWLLSLLMVVVVSMDVLNYCLDHPKKLLKQLLSGSGSFVSPLKIWYTKSPGKTETLTHCPCFFLVLDLGPSVGRC